MTIRERLTAIVGGARTRIKTATGRLVTPRSYGIKDDKDAMFFVEARSVRVDEGRLLFRTRGRLVAVVNADRWERVLEGVELGDFEK